MLFNQDSIEFTEEQKILISEIVKWYNNKNKPYISYSGPPGTGKTTIIKEIINRLNLLYDEVISIAYTGKAVMNLMVHGMRASTLHSLIYDVKMVEIENELFSENERKKYKLDFVLKNCLSENLKLIVVDEASMLNDNYISDLLSFGIPVIFVGDKDQLPPIFGISSVMNKPDFVLTQIMRQSKDNPIVYLSQRVLHDLPLKVGEYGDSKVTNSIEFGMNLLRDYNVILCGKNSTREELCNRIRYELLNCEDKYPIIGDKMICRNNSPERKIDNFYLVNGMVGYVDDIDISSNLKKGIKFDFSPEFLTSSFNDLIMDIDYLMASPSERKTFGLSRYQKFEYAYALTVHLSQGSQYDSELYIYEPFGGYELSKKQAYTAISRAVKKIDIII